MSVVANPCHMLNRHTATHTHSLSLIHSSHPLSTYVSLSSFHASHSTSDVAYPSATMSASPAVRRLNGLTGNVFADPSLHTVPTVLAQACAANEHEASQTKGFDHFSHVKEGQSYRTLAQPLSARSSVVPQPLAAASATHRHCASPPAVCTDSPAR